MAISCDPQSLATAASRFVSTIPAGGRRAVKTYLLCQIENAGLFGPNIVPPGATYSGAGTYTLNVDPNTTYLVVWGTNDTSFNMCGDVYTNPGNGLTTTIYTAACTTLVFTGLGGSTVTAQVHKPKPGSKTPVPSGFTWTMNAAGTTATATWNTPPGFVDSTELWTSSDNVTFTLAATVARPGTSSAQSAPAVGSVKYAKIRWISSTSSPSNGPFTSVLNVPTTVVSGWALRVVTNGGAAPSAATVSSADTFYKSLSTGGILSKIIALNMIAPDSFIAAQTPLIVGPGAVIWNTDQINSGVTLSINGWFDRGGANNWPLKTGCVPSTMGWTAASGGFVFYISVNNATNTTNTLGCSDAANANFCGMNHAYNGVVPSSQAAWLYDLTHQTNAQLGTLAGFFADMRTANNVHQTYFANSTTPFSAITPVEAGVVGAPATAAQFYFAGVNSNGSSICKGVTTSFAALTMGMTSSETQTLYNAVQALRTAFGGGFV